MDNELFKLGMEQTRKCLELNPDGDPIACEVAQFSDGDWYTWHTHPRDVPYPSQEDIDTTRKFHKEYLCIGLVNQDKTICFHESDGFQQIVCEF